MLTPVPPAAVTFDYVRALHADGLSYSTLRTLLTTTPVAGWVPGALPWEGPDLAYPDQHQPGYCGRRFHRSLFDLPGPIYDLERAAIHEQCHDDAKVEVHNRIVQALVDGGCPRWLARLLVA